MYRQKVEGFYILISQPDINIRLSAYSLLTHVRRLRKIGKGKRKMGVCIPFFPCSLFRFPASNVSEKRKFISFGLFPIRSPLLRKSHMLSFPSGTKMIQFPEFPRSILYIQIPVDRHDSVWVSPFGHPRITACLAAPRGLSQPTTSFFGECTSRHPLCALARLLHLLDNY